MSSAYPYELRTRVLAALDSNMPVKEILKTFKICRDTLYKWKNIKKTTGDIKPKKGYQRGHSHKINDIEEFKKFIEANNGCSTKELANRYVGNVSSSTILKMLKKLGYSHKKKRFITPKEVSN